MDSITIFPWDDNFAIGIAKIDEQHKKLVDIINDLATQFTFHPDNIDLSIIFNELLDYTDYHFTTEEGIWHQTLANAENEEKHQETHKKFIDAVKNLIDSQKDKSKDEVAENTLGLLVQWLITHILESDRFMVYKVKAIQNGSSNEEAQKIAIENMHGHTQAMTQIIMKIYESLSNNTLLLMKEMHHKSDIQKKLTQQNTFFQTVVNTIPELIWIKDQEGRYLACNKKFEQLFGATEEEIKGKTDYDFVSKELADSFRTNDKKALERGSKNKNFEWLTYASDNHTELLETTKTPLYDAEQNIIGVLGIGYDITKQSEDARRLQYALQGSSDGLWDWNMVTNELYLSPRWMEMLGYKENELDYNLETFEKLLHPEYKEAVFTMVQDYVAGKRDNYAIEFEMRHKDGSLVYILSRGKLVTNEDGTRLEPMRMVGTHVDITERKKNEKKLAEAAVVYNTTSEGIFFTDKDGLILRVNKAFTKITGYKENEVVGQKTSILKSGKHSKEFYEKLWKKAEEGLWKGEIWNKTKSGVIYPALLTINSINDENGDFDSYVAMFSDISEIKQKEAKLDYLAHHDPLTGLPNRTLLKARLQQTLSSAKRRDYKTALLYFDIDNFKNINDSFGHSVGDELLLAVTKRISSALRDEDTFARLGGDEFVIVLSDFHSLENITTKLISLMELFKEPFSLSINEDLYITISVGVSIGPNDTDDVGELIKNADTAMYKAKNAGKNMYKFFDNDMSASAFERVMFETSLKHAIKNQEFEVFYQPQINFKDNSLRGFEALVRWRHPDLGLVSPDKFIPIAEETRLIIPIGEYVLKQVCLDIREFQSKNIAFGKIAVNVSGVQCRFTNVSELLQRYLTEYEVDAKDIEVELTESVVMDDPQKWIKMLSEMQKIGVEISIDDFGTGYSSLQYLTKLPLDVLKIDRSFVEHLPYEKQDCAVADAIINLSKAMGLKTLAEGIEKEEQLNYLKERGCDIYQGFITARPMAKEDAIEWYVKNYLR